MPAPMTQSDLNKLTIEQRLELIEMLWLSLGGVRDDVPSPDWHAPVVERRLQRMRENPSPGTPAADVLSGLGKSKK